MDVYDVSKLNYSTDDGMLSDICVAIVVSMFKLYLMGIITMKPKFLKEIEETWVILQVVIYLRKACLQKLLGKSP